MELSKKFHWVEILTILNHSQCCDWKRWGQLWTRAHVNQCYSHLDGLALDYKRNHWYLNAYIHTTCPLSSTGAFTTMTNSLALKCPSQIQTFRDFYHTKHNATNTDRFPPRRSAESLIPDSALHANTLILPPSCTPGGRWRAQAHSKGTEPGSSREAVVHRIYTSGAGSTYFEAVVLFFLNSIIIVLESIINIIIFRTYLKFLWPDDILTEFPRRCWCEDVALCSQLPF